MILKTKLLGHVYDFHTISEAEQKYYHGDY